MVSWMIKVDDVLWCSWVWSWLERPLPMRVCNSSVIICLEALCSILNVMLTNTCTKMKWVSATTTIVYIVTCEEGFKAKAKKPTKLIKQSCTRPTQRESSQASRWLFSVNTVVSFLCSDQVEMVKEPREILKAWGLNSETIDSSVGRGGVF